jgi:hypothetical protein
MTSTESLIESQRTELLELGFRQRHGFLYSYGRGFEGRRVDATIHHDGRWHLSVEFPWAPAGSQFGDEVNLEPGTSLETFRRVVESLL